MDSANMGIIKKLEGLIVDPEDTPKLKTLMIGTEVSPYASVGGYASVLAYLSKEISSCGHDIRLFMPKFGFLDESEYKMKYVCKGLEVPTGDETHPVLICNVKEAVSPVNGVTTYFLENEEYYEKRANVYGYSDDPTRWALLSRGALEFIRTQEFVPDIVHVNDWHTGLVPNYLKTVYKKDKILRNIASVLTIHNLSIQGMYLDHKNFASLDFDDGRSDIASFFSERLNKQNFMRRGVLYSDVVNTVSHTYAKEVLTEQHGEGLDKLLLELKGKFFGIINGLDYDEYNPKTDKLVPTNYDIKSLDKRAENKAALQAEYDLEVDPAIPLFGFVGRMERQKGFDLIVEVLDHIMSEHNVQFVQVGGGDGYLESLASQLKEKHPDKVGIHLYYNAILPRLIYSGSDMILFPSRFEPCGIVQLEAMRYGSIPIVRNIGGLADTVENFDSMELTGTGFTFNSFDAFALHGAIVRGIELIKHKNVWRKLQQNAMAADYSWKNSASEYISLYNRAIELRAKGEKSI